MPLGRITADALSWSNASRGGSAQERVGDFTAKWIGGCWPFPNIHPDYSSKALSEGRLCFRC